MVPNYHNLLGLVLTRQSLVIKNKQKKELKYEVSTKK